MVGVFRDFVDGEIDGIGLRVPPMSVDSFEGAGTVNKVDPTDVIGLLGSSFIKVIQAADGIVTISGVVEGSSEVGTGSMLDVSYLVGSKNGKKNDITSAY